MIILGSCSEKVRIEWAGLGSTEKAGACLGRAAVWTAQAVGVKVPQQPGFAQVLVEQVYHREVHVRKLRHRTFSEHEPYPPSLLFVILNETAKNSISLTARITGPGVDVNERSERTTLFRLRFIRLFCGANLIASATWSGEAP